MHYLLIVPHFENFNIYGIFSSIEEVSKFLIDSENSDFNVDTELQIWNGNVLTKTIPLDKVLRLGNNRYTR